MPFQIAPHEAMLLGYSLGRTQGRDLSFAIALRSDVGTFVDSNYLVEDIVTSNDLPEDINYLDVGDIRLGAALSDRGVLYRIRDYDDVLQTRWNPQRRSLLDLIFKEFGHNMQLSPEAKLFYHLDWGEDPRTQWEAFIRLFSGGLGNVADALETNADNWQELNRELCDLAKRNQEANSLELGRSFGMIELYLTQFQELVIEPGGQMYDPPEAEEHQLHRLIGSMIDSLVKALVESERLRPFHRATAVLHSLKSVDLSGAVEYDDSPMFNTIEYFNRVALFLKRLWWAFGDLVAHLAVGEGGPSTDDEPPREFLDVLAEGSQDAVRRRLRVHERALAEHPNDIGKPNDVVSALKDSVEALAKRMWPELSQRDCTFASLLTEKVRTGSGLERRFARIAMSMYFEYRNPATHDPDTFKCSVAEARYFVYGIGALFDIWQQK